MTLQCSNCESTALEIISQSYGDSSAFEAYECKECGATGSLTHNDHPPRTRLDGAVESTSRY
jgi:hypothetical protein